MRLLVDLALTLVIALVVGLGSALAVLNRGAGTGSAMIGAWSVQSALRTARPDPYQAALNATAINLPLGAAEGLTFTAIADDEGTVLSGRCDYVVAGRPLLTRLWTLTLYDRDGRIVANPSNRSGFHSREILRQHDGGFVVALSALPQPGNWMPAMTEADLQLVLRLYETPLTGGALPEDLPLPRIVRGQCR